MKLIKFRIQNYKSIKDSDYCWLASDLTTLAGKNESGKSAVLESLRDFDTNIKTIPDTALPLDDSGEPLIELSFEVDKATLGEIAKEKNILLNKEFYSLINKEGLTILKQKNGSYELASQIIDLLDSQMQEINQQCFKKINQFIGKLKNIEQLTGLTDPQISEDNIGVSQQAINSFITQAKPLIVSIPDEVKKQQATENISTLAIETNNLQKENTANKLLEEIKQYIPNFIFFSDFKDILPFELPLTEAKQNKAIQDFAKVAKLNLDKVIQTTDTQRRRNILSKHSAAISGDFMGYWGQNKLDLVAEADGLKLRLGVKESEKTILFKPEQRSKGFQWFLSFFLRLNAEKDDINIILIDEPGLYLHAKAQKDVLKVLEEVSKNSQVIFSTHSPYLIDPERLDRVRLLLNDGNGTKIENKIHKGADKETLTPIITAIGLDLTQEFSIAGKKSVVLEGISDYYYFQAMKDFLPATIKGLDANLIPCCGAQKVPQIISLLIGWGLDFVSVLDNDTEGKRTAKELKEKLLIDEAKIISISEQDNFSIEDLFTYDDFNSFVLNSTKNTNQGIFNSKFLKNQNIDKVLLAKKFLDQVKKDKSKIKLSKNTINNFKMIFEKIGEYFNHAN
ncbi:MAG: AAA family ATPase [Patescibacteria group bacterium]|nr:AAA family ATPase [Patescibacteria group bacterium]